MNDNKKLHAKLHPRVVCGYVTAIKQLWTITKGRTERAKIKKMLNV